MGYCARLKAIGVNLFRAAKVKRALDALSAAPETLAAAVGPLFWLSKSVF